MTQIDGKEAKAVEKQEKLVSRRNEGVDALRVLATWMVLVLHVLNQGRVLYQCPSGSLSFALGLVLEAATFCAVNCYGLISGYVGIYARFRYSRLAALWLQVALYNILGTLVFYLMSPQTIGEIRLAASVFPVLRSCFWYFTAYFGMFILLPVLNKGVNALRRPQAKALCLGIVVVFSILPTVAGRDSFNTKDGYSIIWLVLLYILGACIRRFDFLAGVRTWVLAVGYALCVGVSAAARLLLGTGKLIYHGNVLIAYTAPTILFCGIALLVIFARMKAPGRWIGRVIGFLAPASFGIYILHMQPYVRVWLFTQPCFTWLAQWPAAAMVAGTLLIASGLFAVCAVIEKLRQLLFKALKISQRLDRLEEKWLGGLWDEAAEE